jgi:hypothetical protein
MGINQYRSGIQPEVNNMARKVSRGAGSSEPDDNNELDNGKPSLGRRALLTRGGVVAAGVVGAGAVATAVAGPASAQTGDPVLMNTANDAGTSTTSTELDADNDTTPTFILNNTGTDSVTVSGTTTVYAGPNLQLTPSTAAGSAPSPSAAGGNLTTTGSGPYTGALWFTHDFGGTPADIVSAPVHTEATANVYAPLATPTRILDTRSASLRTNIINPSGNLDSSGRLKAGKTILINLDNQVAFAETVFANITVTDMVAAGFLTVWSGAGSVPVTSTIDFGSGVTLANFLASAIAEYTAGSTTYDNVIAIYAKETTHVILDVAGFMMPGFEYLKVPLATPDQARNARLKRAQQAMRNAARA